MRYATCPKCRHAPLPEDQASPAACPACGLILAKFGAPLPVREPDPELHEDDSEGRVAQLRALLFYVPNNIPLAHWQGRAFLLGVFVLWTIWIWLGMDIRKGEAGSGFLHMVLLPFHEAGHYLIFRWFGEFIMILGGTLGQHLMPIVFGVALLVQRHDPFGAALCFWLLGFSVVDMSVYMYDAFDPKLVLLGGATGAESDAHDWQNLLGDTGLLRKARGIGIFFSVVGVAMMLAALAWAARLLWVQREHLEESLEPPEPPEPLP